jgi:hypothetical protein
MSDDYRPIGIGRANFSGRYDVENKPMNPTTEAVAKTALRGAWTLAGTVVGGPVGGLLAGGIAALIFGKIKGDGNS